MLPTPFFFLSACRILTDYVDFSLVSLVCLALNLRPSFGSPDRAVVGRCSSDMTMCGRLWMISLQGPTLPETNIAPENRPSQKETSIPTIQF